MIVISGVHAKQMWQMACSLYSELCSRFMILYCPHVCSWLYCSRPLLLGMISTCLDLAFNLAKSGLPSSSSSPSIDQLRQHGSVVLKQSNLGPEGTNQIEHIRPALLLRPEDVISKIELGVPLAMLLASDTLAYCPVKVCGQPISSSSSTWNQIFTNCFLSFIRF